jgi:WD40 repeat protein
MTCKRLHSGLLLLAFMAAGYAQSNPPLRLEKTIPMPDVQGRIDHMFFDAQSGRLFVAALGNNTVEVIDIRQGKRVRSISGLHEPQGILYLSSPNRLYVANGDDGTLRVLDGNSYQPAAATKLGGDADNVRWDDEAHRIYVGYGRGALAVIDEKGAKIGEIPLDAHPESFRLESHGPRIFVNLPQSRKIAVVDKKTKSVIATWTTDDAFENFRWRLTKRIAASSSSAAAQRGYLHWMSIQVMLSAHGPSSETPMMSSMTLQGSESMPLVAREGSQFSSKKMRIITTRSREFQPEKVPAQVFSPRTPTLSMSLPGGKGRTLPPSTSTTCSINRHGSRADWRTAESGSRF